MHWMSVKQKYYALSKIVLQYQTFFNLDTDEEKNKDFDLDKVNDKHNLKKKNFLLFL